MKPAKMLPVCRYDGQCYRKNDDHFRHYAHPTQRPDVDAPLTPAVEPIPAVPTTAPPTAVLTTPSPSPSDGTERDSLTPTDGANAETPVAAPTALAEALPAPHVPATSLADRAPSRGLSHASETAEDLESGAPSLALLQHLMHPCCLPGPAHVGVHVPHGDTAAPFAVADLYPALDHIDTYLQVLYGNALGFHAADVRAVLLAALALNPASPLTAFPGWRLVGPFEAAYRAYEHARALHTTASTSASSLPSTGSTFFDPFHDEAARWRCARYRHDPPECQTVAVAVDAAPAHSPALTETTEASLPLVHVCYHRDEPSAVPSMLVKGGVPHDMQVTVDTAVELPKEAYTWAPVSTGLAVYLLASARAAKDGKTETALSAAMRQAAAADTTRRPAEALPDPDHVTSLAEQQRVATSRRKQRELAATVHGLGVMAPYDTKTELGYRPLAMNRTHLKRLLLDWDAHFVQWCAQLKAAAGAAQTDTLVDTTPRKVARLEPDATTRKVFTYTPWSELQEQFRYADMANDEGDYGLNMELGIDLFSLVHAASLSQSPPAARVVAVEAAQVALKNGAAPVTEEMKRGLSPLLWHTFRVLDCVYMLLDRDVYRHVLRCHIPMLAGVAPLLRRPPMEIATGAHLWRSQ